MITIKRDVLLVEAALKDDGLAATIRQHSALMRRDDVDTQDVHDAVFRLAFRVDLGDEVMREACKVMLVELLGITQRRIADLESKPDVQWTDLPYMLSEARLYQHMQIAEVEAAVPGMVRQLLSITQRRHAEAMRRGVSLREAHRAFDELRGYLSSDDPEVLRAVVTMCSELCARVTVVLDDDHDVIEALERIKLRAQMRLQELIGAAA